MASPDINAEDVSAAVDFLGLHDAVDRNRIGALGICGYSGMSLTAATSDSRIKAVATTSMYDIEMISPRPILLVAGENAHSRYYSEEVYKIASEPKELLIVPGADHVDLYDRLDKIPFAKLAQFFTRNLGVTTSTQTRH